MSESPPPLPETLERLDARIAEQGPDRGDVLDPRGPSCRTVLPEELLRAPLAVDGTSCDPVGGHVRGRARAPHERCLASSGRRPAEVRREAAPRGTRLTPSERETLVGTRAGLPDGEEAER
ncbi:hypothetical protein OG788_16110 [Streptomyces sp. NBC_00647]|uniref:hypothetical protein n=1 Tax=Streptomyces sp. NBC_00647 TaxID=2975796 RepID=UPI003250077A